MKYAACVEYDGARFSGWQTQKHDVRTVQQTLERALTKVADHPVSIITAGRTDSSVHATHQVIHFESESERSAFAWCRGTNRFLDHDVRLHWVVPVDDEFHARFSALTRSYRFIILNQSIASAIFRTSVTQVHQELDFEKMANAGKRLLGEHDFSSFRAAGCQAHSPIRTLMDFKLGHHNEWVWFDVRANAFLQHMVRNIAGTLIDIGSNKQPESWINHLLEVKDRREAGVTAKPNGLYLIGVEYPSEFQLPSARQSIAFWSK